MRIAFLGDIHGNLTALEAVLRDIQRTGADETVCLGDLVFKGPEGEACVERIAALGVPLVTGNTDRYILEDPPDLAEALRLGGQAAEQAERVKALLDWHRQRLSGAALDFLRGGKPSLRIDPAAGPGKEPAAPAAGTILAVHGSPRTDEEAIFPHASEAELEQILREVAEPLVAFGHSHFAFVRPSHGKLLLGAGSVGRPFDRDPRAAWLLLEADGGDTRAAIRRVAYDVEATAGAARTAEMPGLDAYLDGIRTGRNL